MKKSCKYGEYGLFEHLLLLVIVNMNTLLANALTFIWLL